MIQNDLKCSLLSLQQLLGKKWTTPILYEFEDSVLTFNDIKRLTNNQINPTLLSQTLKDLEKYNVICKFTDNKICYKLTEEGKELLIILISLKKWGEKYSLSQKNCEHNSCMKCGFFLCQNK